MNIDEIRARCEAATPAMNPRHIYGLHEGCSICAMNKRQGEANADFIEHAQLDMEYLISETARLRAELEAAQRREKAAENDMAQMLKVMPVSICKKFCRNASAHCAGWCEYSPKWRGPDAEVSHGQDG